MVYIREDPRKFLESEGFLPKEELRKEFGSGTVVLRHDYVVSRYAKHKKKKKRNAESGSYLKRQIPKSRILRVFSF